MTVFPILFHRIKNQITPDDKVPLLVLSFQEMSSLFANGMLF